MKTYRAKPVEVKAYQSPDIRRLMIKGRLEQVVPGDWVVDWPGGLTEVVPPGRFKQRFEEVIQEKKGKEK